MPRERRRFTQRRIQFFFGAILACILYSELGFDDENKPSVGRGAPVVLAAEVQDADPFEKLIRVDPLQALIIAHERYASKIADYECLFTKQEMLASGMSAEQDIAIKFRSEPFSVVMTWERNPGLARRVIYVKDKWIDDDETDPRARQQFLAQPGKLAALIVKSVKQPVNGVGAKRAARRSVDEFGFQRALELLVKYCKTAKSRNELKLEFRGESVFDGRSVWVVTRQLPYDGDEDPYPDRTADIYIDKTYRIPIAVYCYSNEDRKPEHLLGKYEYRNIRFDVGLKDSDFEPATYGM